MQRAAAVLIIIGVLIPLVAVVGAEAGTQPTVRTYARITCTWPANTSDGAVVCERSDGTGLVGVVAQRFVLVKTAKGKVLFFKNQPTHSPGFGPLRDKRVFHSETHRGIICSWSRVGGGAAGCNRADRHGYVVFVGQQLVAVSDEASKFVYLRNQG